MTHILVIWTIVTSAYARPDVYDWRPVGQFETKAACEAAGVELRPNRQFRCLSIK